MSEAPKKIRITGEYDGNFYADLTYIRADLVDGLVEALEVAMATFRFYEGYHSRKGSSLKEQQNKEFADVMEAALKALEEE